jgi:hypothetical protein
MNNQKGSTLVVVLLIMATFSIVGLSLMALNATTTLQVTKTGDDLKATNVAEMGVVHLQEEIYQIVTSNTGKTLGEIKDILQNNLPSNIHFQSKTGKNPDYQVVRNDPVKIEPIDNIDRLIIPFTLVGYSNEKSKSISGKVIVINTFPLVPAGTDPITGTPLYEKQGNDREETFEDSVYYNEGFSLSSNFSITYELDLFSQGDITLVSNTDIWIKGDAYVSNLNLSTTGSGSDNNANQSLMCVEGTLTIYGPKPNVTMEERENINCQDIINYNNYSGIFAKDIIYEPRWELITDANY